METRPGLKDCLFSAETQTCIIQRIIDYVKQKGVVKATPLFGTIPPEEPLFNVSGHQTSQNFLKDQSECTIDTLRFDLLAQDLMNPLMSNDPVFLTWMVLWILYVSSTLRSEIIENTPPFLATQYFEHFDERMVMYITGSIDYNDRTNTEITTLEAPTAVSKEWHLYEQFASLVPQ